MRKNSKIKEIYKNEDGSTNSDEYDEDKETKKKYRKPNKNVTLWNQVIDELTELYSTRIHQKGICIMARRLFDGEHDDCVSLD